MPETALAVMDLVKEYQAGHRAVDGVTLEVESGELLAILGPSGCGKTTILRTIAGLIQPTSGRILSHGIDITGLPPHRRNFGLVFQSYALFPHLTVRDNVAYGLRMRGARDPSARVDQALRLVKLGQLADRYPLQLSGGQQQRVALARAVVINPDALLLDEPLSNLDLKLRTELRLELNELRRQQGWTTLFVTHDQTEALSMADKVVVMNEGRVQQAGKPADVYQHPRNTFVAAFIGETNLIDGDVRGRRIEVDGRYHIDLPPGSTPDSRVTLSVRPEAIRLLDPPASPNGWPQGTVVSSLYGGATVRCLVELDSGRRVIADVPASEPGTRQGGRVAVHWDPRQSVCLEES
jgi:ABC-type Fe3+/spermidine/putrescine transport system ATPase subunit